MSICMCDINMNFYQNTCRKNSKVAFAIFRPYVFSNIHTHTVTVTSIEKKEGVRCAHHMSKNDKFTIYECRKSQRNEYQKKKVSTWCEAIGLL